MIRAPVCGAEHAEVSGQSTKPVTTPRQVGNSVVDGVRGDGNVNGDADDGDGNGEGESGHEEQ